MAAACRESIVVWIYGDGNAGVGAGVGAGDGRRNPVDRAVAQVCGDHSVVIRHDRGWFFLSNVERGNL
jgi:hypothetical protein